MLGRKKAFISRCNKGTSLSLVRFLVLIRFAINFAFVVTLVAHGRVIVINMGVLALVV